MSDLRQNRNHVPEAENLCDPAGPNICDPCQRIRELDTRIRTVKMMLASLENERQSLKHQVNQNHDRFIHRLPPEIATQIFEHCIPEDLMDLDLQSVSSRTIYAPFVLSAVCRRWRNIVRSTPRMWKTLPLLFQASNSDSLPNTLLAQEWIDHAGQLPLSLNVCISFDCGPRYYTIQTIRFLNQFSNRWLNLKYQGPSEFLLYLVGDTEDLPQLRTLKVEESFYYGIQSTTLKLRPRRLNALSISRMMLIALDFDWRSLKELDIGFVPLSEFLEALRRAPRVTKCTLRWEHQRRSTFMLPLEPIVHLRIQHLEITAPLHIQIFEHLLCPSLKTLVLGAPGERLDIPLILNFLGQCGCFLESLSLIHVDLSGSDIVSLCEGIPTLQHLTLGLINSVPRSLFARLAEFSTSDGNREPRYFPDLRSLSFDHHTFDDWSMLPDIFELSTYSPARPIERHRHALQSIAVSTFSQATPTWFNSDLVYNIDEETLKRILRLSDLGVKWKIHVGRDKENLIELAAAHYGKLSA